MYKIEMHVADNKINEALNAAKELQAAYYVSPIVYFPVVCIPDPAGEPRHEYIVSFSCSEDTLNSAISQIKSDDWLLDVYNIYE